MTGAQFEIRIDGTPRTYRDRKDFAIEAAEFLKTRNPQSVVLAHKFVALSDRDIPLHQVRVAFGHSYCELRLKLASA
jgi:hypothetical protein